MAYTSADLTALKAAIKSGAKSVRLPNGQSITLQDAAYLQWLMGKMKTDISGQRPSVHRTVFERGL